MCMVTNHLLRKCGSVSVIFHRSPSLLTFSLAKTAGEAKLEQPGKCCWTGTTCRYRAGRHGKLPPHNCFIRFSISHKDKGLRRGCDRSIFQGCGRNSENLQSEEAETQALHITQRCITWLRAGVVFFFFLPYFVALFSRETWSYMFLRFLQRCMVYPESQRFADWFEFNCITWLCKSESLPRQKSSGFHKMLWAKMPRQTESRSKLMAIYRPTPRVIWSRPRPLFSLRTSLNVSE